MPDSRDLRNPEASGRAQPVGLELKHLDRFPGRPANQLLCGSFLAGMGVPPPMISSAGWWNGIGGITLASDRHPTTAIVMMNRTV